MTPLQIVITRKSDDTWRILFMNERGTIHDDTTGKGGIMSLIDCHLESLAEVRGLAVNREATDHP